MMENLGIYQRLRAVPEEAQKLIGGGRLKGMTDINPMWRIKALTELFGPCGVGWKYELTDKRLCPGNGAEVAAFVDIDLFVKVDGAWSEAIPGTGGAMFVASEKNGPYTSDECFKMALTDAISVSCKALGVGADIYWSKDRTKYDQTPETEAPPSAPKAPKTQPPEPRCAACGCEIKSHKSKSGKSYTAAEMAEKSTATFGRALCSKCSMAAGEKAEKREGA